MFWTPINTSKVRQHKNKNPQKLKFQHLRVYHLINHCCLTVHKLLESAHFFAIPIVDGTITKTEKNFPSVLCYKFKITIPTFRCYIEDCLIARSYLLI